MQLKNTSNSIQMGDIARRYGGEELTMILPAASLEVTVARAEAIREGVKHLHSHHLQPLGAISVSLGVACFTEHGLTVIQAADVELYRAKAEGRDRVCGTAGSLRLDSAVR